MQYIDSDSEPEGELRRRRRVSALRCDICSRTYSSAAQLRAHTTRAHRGRQVDSGRFFQGFLHLQDVLETQNENVPSSSPEVQLQGAFPTSQQNELPFDPANNVTSIPEDADVSGLHEVLWDQMPQKEATPAEVAQEVTNYYKEFGDSSEPLFPNPIELSPPYSSLHNSCKDLISFCIKHRLTLGQAASQYSLLSKRDSYLPDTHASITKSFPTAQAFVSYLVKVRQRAVQEEGWNKAIIRTESGTNQTGVFRSPLKLMLEKLEKAGGHEKLEGFREISRDSCRVYSAPWNSDVMGDYHRVLTSQGRDHGKVVGVDVYCDGTALAKSGSQSAHTLRIRFPNLRTGCDEWHEIGIAPVLAPREDGGVRTREESRRERMQLFQRFLFVALRDLIDVSSSGLVFDSVILFPRIVMIVSDQPQERQFMSLRGADSFCDCTHCTMQSRRKRCRRNAGIRNDTPSASRVKRRKLGTQQPQPRQTSVSSAPNSPCSSITSAETTREERTLLKSSNEEEYLEILNTQLSNSQSEKRDVCQTVHAQLTVARHNRTASVLAPETAEEARKRKMEVSKARKHLEEVSALPLPPALAAFEGMGSEPFNLYRSCAFDKLHVLDLGLLRLIPDHSCERFEDRSRTGLPVSQTIQVTRVSRYSEIIFKFRKK